MDFILFFFSLSLAHSQGFLWNAASCMRRLPQERVSSSSLFIMDTDSCRNFKLAATLLNFQAMLHCCLFSGFRTGPWVSSLCFLCSSKTTYFFICFSSKTLPRVKFSVRQSIKVESEHSSLLKQDDQKLHCFHISFCFSAATGESLTCL